MRLGLLGGTFDPPHLGHLLAATDVLEAVPLDRILFVPNAIQPLKGAGHASAGDRVAMLRLMLADDARFGVETLEVDRDGLSFTVDTLETLTKQHVGAELYFLVGEDVLGSFPKWRDTARILQLAKLVVLTRDVSAAARDRESVEPGIGEQNHAMEAAGISAQLPDGAMFVPTRRVDISSSEIRLRVQAGRSTRGFLSPAVDSYVRDRGLYTQVNRVSND